MAADRHSATVPVYLLIPLFAAVLYALGSITIKRALREGVGMRQTFHLSNVVLGVTFLPLLAFGFDQANWAEIWRPFVMGSVFFVGNWLTFVAIQRGDVSLVTPLMGTKVVFVALGVVVLVGKVPSLGLWIAAFLTTLAIFVMGITDLRRGKRLLFTVCAALSSAAIFAISDVLVSAWAVPFGALPFLAVGSTTVSLWSLVIWLVQRRPTFFPKVAGGRYAWWGALLIAGQAMVLSFALAFFSDATGVNIVYASRGLWVIALVMAFGTVLGNSESKDAGRGFFWRVAGTILLTVAIVIAVMERMNYEL